jgi:hypothetical protein
VAVGHAGGDEVGVAQLHEPRAGHALVTGCGFVVRLSNSVSDSVAACGKRGCVVQ